MSKKKNNKDISKEKKPFGLKKSFNYKLIFPIVIIVLAIALFSRTVPYELVNCDDDFMVLENQEFNKEFSNIFASFDRTFFEDDVYYRPILNISFIIDYQIAGLDVWIYRLSNLIYHAIASLLVYFFFIKLRFRLEYAFLFSILFVVHPLIAPSTLWIAGRNDSLLAIFILLSFITLIKYKDCKNSKKSQFLFLHFLVYAAALYTKETAALSPFLMAGYLLFFRGKEKFFSKENIYLPIGWVIIGLIWFIQRQVVVNEAIGSGELQLSLVESFIENLPSFIAYVSKTFIPVRMSPLANYETFSLIIGAIIVLGIMTYVFINKNINRKVILFGFLWYLFFIVPSMLARIRDFDFDYAEHRVYIPIIGILIIIIEIIRSLNINFRKPMEYGIFGVVFLLFTVNTISYQNEFKGPLQFWGHFIKTYPNTTRGFIGVGKYYFVRKDFDKVEKIMKKGISVKPEFKYWYTNLSTIYLQQQNYPLAEQNARLAVKYDPNDFQALKNLAYSLGSQGKFKQAVPHLEKALKVAKEPDPILLSRLADAYNRSGYTDASIRAYNHLISLNPRNDATYYDLAQVYSNNGEFKKALEVYEKIKKIAPGSEKLYINLGTLYAKHKDYTNAENSWMKALKSGGSNKEIYFNLINLYIITGRKQEAKALANDFINKGGEIPSRLNKMLN